MKLTRLVSLSAVLAVAAPIDFAEAAECLNDLTPSSGGEAFLSCLKVMQAEIDVLNANNLYAIPKGAVVAFDRADGCPGDWTPFEAGAGRMIIGVGGQYELPYAGGEPRYHTGGAEMHTLTVEEMPAHTHGLGLLGLSGVTPQDALSDARDIDIVWYQNGSSVLKEGFEARANAIMSEAGSGDAHNNMPPYIALYFCKKEG